MAAIEFVPTTHRPPILPEKASGFCGESFPIEVAFFGVGRLPQISFSGKAHGANST